MNRDRNRDVFLWGAHVQGVHLHHKLQLSDQEAKDGSGGEALQKPPER